MLLVHSDPEGAKLHPDVEVSTDRVQVGHLSRSSRAEKNGATEVQRWTELVHFAGLEGLGGPPDVKEVGGGDGEPGDVN